MFRDIILKKPNLVAHKYIFQRSNVWHPKASIVIKAYPDNSQVLITN